MTKSVNLVGIETFLKRYHKENDPDRKSHKAKECVMPNKNDVKKAVGIDTNSWTLEKLRSHPGLSHNKKAKSNEEIPLYPEALDLNLTFFIFAGSQAHYFVKRVETHYNCYYCRV